MMYRFGTFGRVSRTVGCWLAFLLVASVATMAQEAGTEEATGGAAGTRVALDTSKGTIVLELDDAKAPETVANFLAYVDAGFYDGTIFHRVIPRFMVQAGGFTAEMQKKDTRPPIQNEADNGLPNGRGTISMARTNDPHSATAQFFINTVDNQSLDHTAKNARGWGYAVFGKVVEGMDVVDAISAVRTSRRGPMANVPEEAVVIEKASRQ